MGAIFASLGRTIIAGIVLLIVFIVIAGLGTGAWIRVSDYGWWSFFFRWLHVLSGVMWIGLLWYFNFVQTPSMPKIPDEQKPAVSKVIAPTALFWFGQMTNHTLNHMIAPSHIPRPIAKYCFCRLSAPPM